jgi:hypothetical protein
MLIAANSFPRMPVIRPLVWDILDTGREYVGAIQSMIKQGSSPVDQFKFILISHYDLDFDSEKVQQYLAPGVPDFFNS